MSLTVARYRPRHRARCHAAPDASRTATPVASDGLDINAVNRNEYPKEAFELVRELNQLGVVVYVGNGTRTFGAGAKATNFRTFCLVAWLPNEVHENDAFEN